MYKVDELLLLEILTYTVDIPPMKSILNAEGETVGDYMSSIPLDQIDDDVFYNTYMNGYDWKNLIMAIRKNPDLCKAYISEAHLDDAYGAGGGVMTVAFEVKEEPRTVVITFIDSGTPFDPLKMSDPDVTLPAESRDVGGLGVFLVKKTMDAVSYKYENGKNMLRIEKQI